MFIQNAELHTSQTSNFRPAGLIFMVEHTARNPNTWVLSGEAAPSREWLNIGWDEVKSWSIKQGSSALLPPYNNKIWLYNFNNPQPHIGHQKCDKYYSVFAPGTQDTRHLAGPSEQWGWR